MCDDVLRCCECEVSWWCDVLSAVWGCGLSTRAEHVLCCAGCGVCWLFSVVGWAAAASVLPISPLCASRAAWPCLAVGGSGSSAHRVSSISPQCDRTLQFTHNTLTLHDQHRHILFVLYSTLHSSRLYCYPLCLPLRWDVADARSLHWAVEGGTLCTNAVDVGRRAVSLHVLCCHHTSTTSDEP